MFQSLELKHPKFYQYFRVLVVIFASVLYAWNLCCFAKTVGLLPGGFSGVSLLLQEIGSQFFHINVPFTVFNVALNLFPVYLGFRYIGKKFTIYSIVTIVLSSIFVDILPVYVFTNDILLVSVFGGLINGFAISLCLNVGTTTGGTDFISIFLSEQKGIDAWNYILAGNVIVLGIAGLLFGWKIALYSIIISSAAHRSFSCCISVIRRRLCLSYPIMRRKSIKRSKKLQTTMRPCFKVSGAMRKKKKPCCTLSLIRRPSGS